MGYFPRRVIKWILMQYLFGEPFWRGFAEIHAGYFKPAMERRAPHLLEIKWKGRCGISCFTGVGECVHGVEFSQV
jgi:hypothetical protein